MPSPPIDLIELMHLLDSDSAATDPRPTTTLVDMRLFGSRVLQRHGHAAPAERIQVFEGGITHVLNALVGATMLPEHTDNYLLAAAGFDPSSMDPLPGLGSTVILKELTEDLLRDDWFVNWANPSDQIVLYVPLVNELTGQVLTRERAHGIARAVLSYNRDRGNRRPVLVFANDSDNDSFHDEKVSDYAQPIGMVSGAELRNSTLGHMSDWTVTAVAPRTAGSSTADVSFAFTNNPDLHAALATKATDHTQWPVEDKLLTASPWTSKDRNRVTRNLRYLRQAASRTNSKLGFNAVSVSRRTAAGWHTAIRLHPRVFPMPSDKAIFQLTWCHPDEQEWRVIKARTTFSGLFAWHYRGEHDSNRSLTLRVNLAVTDDEIAERIAQLERTVASLSQLDHHHLRAEPATAHEHHLGS
nr:hypothetical protein [Kibdelosporangium sp. MJ126-NF4]CTQ99238.1 hypothetical protein [Kibdelosporangium sp. MJ126-NF4]